MYYVYVLRCQKPLNYIPPKSNLHYGNGYYVGMSSDWQWRILQHLTGIGAKYTKKYRPITLCHLEEYSGNEKEARKREIEVRGLIKNNNFGFSIDKKYLPKIQNIKRIYLQFKHKNICPWKPKNSEGRNSMSK